MGSDALFGSPWHKEHKWYTHACKQNTHTQNSNKINKIALRKQKSDS